MATVTIGTGTSSYDASSLSGGDIINITSGSRGSLTISNATGSAGNPIIIRNNGGTVAIDAAGSSYGLELDDCEYFELTGQGDAAMYGITIEDFTNSGLFCDSETENGEVHHLEIGPDRSGSSGIAWRTLESDVDPFTVNDIHIHHCYIHDVDDEAMYINHHSTQTNPGQPMVDVEIAWCKLRAIGRDGIQIRNMSGTVKIHHNDISDVGDNVTGTGQPGAGIIIGHETEDAEVYRNWITDCIRGIYGLHHETDCNIHHNLIENCNTYDSKNGIGIWIGTNGDGILIEHNTVLDCQVYGIRTSSGDSDGTIKNCIAAGNGTDISSSYTTSDNNTGTIASQDFRSSDNLRHLTASSPAVGNADDGSDCGWLDYN